MSKANDKNAKTKPRHRTKGKRLSSGRGEVEAKRNKVNMGSTYEDTLCAEGSLHPAKPEGDAVVHFHCIMTELPLTIMKAILECRSNARGRKGIV